MVPDPVRAAPLAGFCPEVLPGKHVIHVLFWSDLALVPETGTENRPGALSDPRVAPHAPFLAQERRIPGFEPGIRPEWPREPDPRTHFAS